MLKFSANTRGEPPAGAGRSL